MKRAWGATGLALAMLASLGVGISYGDATSQSKPASAKDVATELQARAQQYLDLRKQFAGTPPKSTDSPEVVAGSQRALGNKIQVARAGAKQGEVFTPRVANYLRKRLASALKGAHGKQIHSSLRSAEPVNIELHINQNYPENVPLQSTPPSLLLTLPQLPDGLEYRLLGRELVLRDMEANIVVDYIPNALPTAKTK